MLDAIVESAARLCRTTGARLHLVQGDQLVPSAVWGDARIREPFPLRPEGTTGQAVYTGRTTYVRDRLADSRPRTYPDGARSIVAVPLVHNGTSLGLIGLTHPDRDAFSDAQIALLETFADQAVIAIENVRLFTELNARNAELREALEQQTVTGEVLRVISLGPSAATSTACRGMSSRSSRTTRPMGSNLSAGSAHLASAARRLSDGP
jgi:GAF domain-containing protein